MNTWISSGVIEPSKSPCGSPAIIVHRNSKLHMDEILQAFTGSHRRGKREDHHSHTQGIIAESSHKCTSMGLCNSRTALQSLFWCMWYWNSLYPMYTRRDYLLINWFPKFSKLWSGQFWWTKLKIWTRLWKSPGGPTSMKHWTFGLITCQDLDSISHLGLIHLGFLGTEGGML